MVSDIVYYCRINNGEWRKFSEHPARSLEAVADIYSHSVRASGKFIVSVKNYKEGPVSKFEVSHNCRELKQNK